MDMHPEHLKRLRAASKAARGDGMPRYFSYPACKPVRLVSILGWYHSIIVDGEGTVWLTSGREHSRLDID